MVYVGQGDGILIQLPHDEEGGSNDDGSEASSRIDVMIDGGSSLASNATRMLDFIQRLYPDQEPTIEHAVITHHDLDHISGLTHVLESESVGVQHVYHNGLASFAPGARGLPAAGLPTGLGVYNKRTGGAGLSKALGLFDLNSARFADAFVMDDLGELRESFQGGELQGVYGGLAAALVQKTSPMPVETFRRVSTAGAFLPEVEGVRFEVLWPPPELTRYPARATKSGSGWGETINGNSITFRLRYGSFEMLFTGDHNDESEDVLLEHLAEEDQLSALACDVLKVPHHGSSHNLKEFFDAANPVLSVASQGEKGAKSKRLSSAAWQHPSDEVIRWLGGSHRVYLTQLKEKRFKWDGIDTQQKLQALYETKHILIETDGEWFRIVEVPLDWPDLNAPPTIRQTARSDGTRWVRTE